MPPATSVCPGGTDFKVTWWIPAGSQLAMLTPDAYGSARSSCSTCSSGWWLEQFDGLAVLTTNRKGDLDTAFVRRLRFIIDFRAAECGRA